MPLIGRRLIVVILLHGCRPTVDDPRRVPVEVVVEDDFGTRLDGVPIQVDGDEVGLSDADGVLRTSVLGAPGSLVHISQECPEGHRKLETEVTLRIRRFAMKDSVPPLSVAVRCRSELRIAAIVVRTPGHAGILIHVDGEMAAETNALGLAHIVRTVPPGHELLVELDASGQPQLRPRRTSRVLDIGDSHDVFVIEQHYEQVRMARKANARRRRIIRIE